jgi:hypothetical protein
LWRLDHENRERKRESDRANGCNQQPPADDELENPLQAERAELALILGREIHLTRGLANGDHVHFGVPCPRKFSAAARL